MPELPEVDTIKSQLQTILPFKISQIYFSPHSTSLIKKTDFDLMEKVIYKISRHGKWLLFDLKPLGCIMSYLGMSGTWRLSHSPLNEKHKHIEFIDEHNPHYKYLSYVDPRRFGHFYILNNLNFNSKMKTLPYDVTSKDFDENQITELLFMYPERKIKSYLLDQKAFPGIGNYLASEICARAGILPIRPAGSLEPVEIFNLSLAIKTVIHNALISNGTTFGGGYRDSFGEKGMGVNHLVVFHQKLCQMCYPKGIATPIIKTIQDGRGTYHCPRCQK